MDSLSLEQLKKIPWNGTVNNIRYDPPVEEIPEYLNIPFEKRKEYPLFYSWLEITRSVPKASLEVLDVSCGAGQISQVLAFRGHRVSACDKHDYFRADRSAIDFKCPVNANDPFPYPDQSFDTIICCEAFQYYDSMKHFITESYRMLKKEGTLIVSIPNIHSIAGKLCFLIKNELQSYHGQGERFGAQVLYLQSVIQRLEQCHFRINEIKGNIPLKNAKLTFVDLLIRSFSKYTPLNNTLKWAHSLIIVAVKS